jgi:hypothetical protein
MALFSLLRLVLGTRRSRESLLKLIKQITEIVAHHGYVVPLRTPNPALALRDDPHLRMITLECLTAGDLILWQRSHVATL